MAVVVFVKCEVNFFLHEWCIIEKYFDFSFFKHVQFYILSDLLSSIVVCVIKYPEQILQRLYSC